MTKTLLIAFLTIGCGGAEVKVATAVPTLQLVQSEVVMTHAYETPIATETQQDVPVPPPVQDPPESVAHADLIAVDGSNAVGAVTFEQSKGQVTMAGTFSGLSPGLHGFVVHAKGDCRARAIRAGKHFNPTKAKHGPPQSAQRHAGDFGNLVVDMNGVATFAMTTDSLTVAAGPDSVVGLAIVVHARRDDGDTQPSGNSGPAVMCGVIELKPVLLADE